MRKTGLTLFIVAISIWLISTIASSRVADNIASTLKDDAVAVLGLAVELEKVDLNLASGRAEITGLQIANPPGFPSENVFDMSRIQVDISVLSLLPAAFGWRPYRLEEIVIESPVVFVDIDKSGRSNLDLILQKVRQSQQAAAKTSQKNNHPENKTGAVKTVDNKERQSADTHQPARISVSQLSIEDLTFNINRAGKDNKTGTLPPINMQNVGGEKGITAAGLGLKVSTRLATDILSAVLLNKAMDRLNGSSGGLLNLLGNKIQEN